MFYKKQSASRMLAIPLTVGLTIVVGIVTAIALGVDEKFLMDPTLGGRTNADLDLSWGWLRFSQPFTTIGELTYLSMFSSFGFLGLLSFLLWFCFPICKALSNVRNIQNNNLAKAATISMCLYAAVAFVDGAFLLIPVVPIYWVMVCLALGRTRPDENINAPRLRYTQKGERNYVLSPSVQAEG